MSPKANKRQREAEQEKEKDEEQEVDSEELDSEDGSSHSSDDDSDSGDSDEFPDVSEDNEDDDDDEDDEGGEAEKEIVIDFEFFPPKEIDFLGLKSLLFTYLDGQQYDCSGLVDAVIKQDNVGSVVKTSEDDDPIAVFTVLNTRKHAEQEWLKQLRAFLQSKCSNQELVGKMDEAFSQQGSALLLNERLINAPPKLAPPLLQFLLEEVKEAAQDKELPQEEREAFQIKRYIVATRVFEDTDPSSSAAEAPADDGAGPSSGSAKKKQKKEKAVAPPTPPAGASPVIVYLRPEDEFLHKHCAWSYTFPVEGRSVGKNDLRPLRMVMLVDAGKMGAVRKEMDAVVGNMAADAAAMPPPPQVPKR